MDLSELASLFGKSQQTLATVESCTGGGIAAKCTDIPGSSTWFVGGLVTYSNAMKVQLGVNKYSIDNQGAVSKEVAEQMATQGRQYCQSDWCVAVTGIAGPGGGSPEKPVGTVWFAWAGPSELVSECRVFSGSRAQIRAQTVVYSLTKLTNLLK